MIVWNVHSCKRCPGRIIADGDPKRIHPGDVVMIKDQDTGAEEVLHLVDGPIAESCVGCSFLSGPVSECPGLAIPAGPGGGVDIVCLAYRKGLVFKSIDKVLEDL